MPDNEHDPRPTDDQDLLVTADSGSDGGGDDDGNIDWEQVYPTVSQPLQVATLTSSVLVVVHVIIIIVFACLPWINGILAALHLILAIYFFRQQKAVSSINARYLAARSAIR